MIDDKTTTIEFLKKEVENFCKKRDWDQFHNPKELSIGISTEANELLQIFRFKTEQDMYDFMKSDRKIKAVEELADVLYFVLRFAQMYDIDLSQSLEDKLIKNDQKYPVEKAKGCNKKYNEYDNKTAKID